MFKYTLQYLRCTKAAPVDARFAAKSYMYRNFNTQAASSYIEEAKLFASSPDQIALLALKFLSTEKETALKF